LSHEPRKLDIKKYVNSAVKRLGAEMPETIKGVKGTTNKDRTPEAIEKGILRALHGIYVNKDGTSRYDAIEEPITHFKPFEIGVTVKKLIELGYEMDKDGNPLNDPEQVLELKPQDVILPDCEDWIDSTASDVLIRISKFVDDLLQKMYMLSPFYNVTKKEDLLGHLVIGLAPHTSAGILGRIIGFSETQAYYAHPYFHAAMRRNADGDESSIILLMDALLNFSRQYLPDSRGSRTMDAPLVLTTRLDPNEVDNEVHNLDVVEFYPIGFYEATLEFKSPNEFKIEQISDRLGKKSQYEGIRYTHKVSDLNSGPHISSYKTLATMQDKVREQMNLAKLISAVDVQDVATLVIEKHFIRDIKGNLRRYTNQKFRCVNCNRKYRRVPLIGKCVCGGKIIMTVAAGTVSKYLEPSLRLARDYDIPEYYQQTLDILRRRIESLFGKEVEIQTGLGEFSSQIT
jgi:DNA polymerase II large subunit